MFKRIVYKFRGDTFVNIVLSPFWKGVYFKSKEFAQLRRKLFPFELGPFPERVNKQEITQVISTFRSLVIKCGDVPSVSSPVMSVMVRTNVCKGYSRTFRLKANLNTHHINDERTADKLQNLSAQTVHNYPIKCILS